MSLQCLNAQTVEAPGSLQKSLLYPQSKTVCKLTNNFKVPISCRGPSLGRSSDIRMSKLINRRLSKNRVLINRIRELYSDLTEVLMGTKQKCIQIRGLLV